MFCFPELHFMLVRDILKHVFFPNPGKGTILEWTLMHTMNTNGVDGRSWGV